MKKNKLNAGRTILFHVYFLSAGGTSEIKLKKNVVS